RRGGDDREDQRARCPGARRRHPVRRERLDRRGRGHGGRGGRDGDDARAQGRARRRGGTLPRRRRDRRRHRARTARDRARAALAPASTAGRTPASPDRVNKSPAGSVLVVGGAGGPTGAAALAARAAFRADAGYVAIAAPADALPTLETLVLEAVKRPLEATF